MPFSVRRRFAVSIVATVVVALAATGVAAARGAHQPESVDLVSPPAISTPAEGEPAALPAIVPVAVPATPSAGIDSAPEKVERPAFVVAASEKGRLVKIDAKTGKTVKVLGTFTDERQSNLLGSTVAASPDGKWAYFEVRNTGDGEVPGSILRISTSGGKAVKIADGMTPELDASGTRLSYFRYVKDVVESEGVSYTNFNLSDLIVRDLESGSERTVATNVSCACGTSALSSWSPDASHIAVQGMQCGCGDGDAFLDLRVYDASKTDSFSTVAVPQSIDKKASWAFPSYLPDGNMFVLEVPNYDGTTGSTTGAARMLIVEPSTGHVVRVLTTGFVDRYYTGADVDRSGQHLLYLSNGNLMASDDMHRPERLATGLIGADW